MSVATQRNFRIIAQLSKRNRFKSTIITAGFNPPDCFRRLEKALADYTPEEIETFAAWPVEWFDGKGWVRWGQVDPSIITEILKKRRLEELQEAVS